jgi:hypothetical protein
MTHTDWIGSFGVTLLLIAFLLNLSGRLKKESFIYLLMNLTGAGLACYASILLHYLPFIILEGSWTLVSIFGMGIYFTTRNKVK